MIGNRTRRSIAFQLWLRLSAITVTFTLFALTLYLWLQITDNIRSAHQEAAVQADAVASAVTRLTSSGVAPGPGEIQIAQTLGVEEIQILNSDGTVNRRLGSLTGPTAEVPAELVDGKIAAQKGYSVRLSDGGFTPMHIGTLDLLRGGQYGAVFVFPSVSGRPPVSLRLILVYKDISHDAQVLFVRSLALTGAILAVAVLAMWLLLYRFVAQPLQEYSRTAMRIAAGEPLRMPDSGTDELGHLGQAINSMAEILRHQATVDPLTGLYNVRHLTLHLEDVLTEAKLNNTSLALVVCDLDNLKPVNDTHGHHAGDLLIKMVARQLLNWAGIDYTCWRTGGDEFAAVNPDIDPERAIEDAAELERSVNATTIGVPGGEVSVSISIGVAIYPADGDTTAALMNVADLRMYESKSRKTNRTASTLAAS